MDYQPKSLEQKWRAYWTTNKIYKVENNSTKPKYYVLDMFPYPSGAGLHVGHPLGYIASDIYARYKRLNGYNVLHPMGYDAFGLPAEQYAIQTGVHPADSTATNIAKYRSQLDNLGFSFDWDRQVNTSDASYYKWTQKIFIMLFEHYYDVEAQKAKPIKELVAQFALEGNSNCAAATTDEVVFTAEEWNVLTPAEKDVKLMNYRLAYRKEAFVNWCEGLGTVLANDEVKDGRSERGNFPVIKKPMLQWALRITAYADRLLNGLNQVDFSEALKTQQRNWIGRSEGAKLFFDLEGSDKKIEVFTTRPDTIFGVSFMVMAPEHDWISEITTAEQKEEIEEYQKYVASRSERDRMADVETVTGAFTGAYVKHPFTGKSIPVWISEYVLAGYGTGAIMAVPCGDERDARFAKKFEIEIPQILDQSAFENAGIGDKVGKIINSDFLNGLEVKTAIEITLNRFEELGIGERKVNFRLRDANFSRQRYWGEPFPVKYDKDGIVHIEEQLPLELPKLTNFKPTSSGQPPLARAEDWVQADGFTRELDTMPGFAGSSWYFLRYMDAENKEEAFSQDAVNYWQDVDLYLGGAEHAVGHLMYSRFWHKFLYDLNIVPTDEPYKKLVNQGMIQGVIESLYMLKDKQDGKTVFVSADMIENYVDNSYTSIYVHIDFVTNYGDRKSYLNAEGREEFKAWRKEYANAEFVLNKEGQLVTHSEVGKMSKSKYNVINPDTIVDQYGTDCFRMYEMFLGPLEQSKPWDTKGITGVSKFLRKFWSLFADEQGLIVSEEAPTKAELKILHKTIKQIQAGLENFSFNTCVSDFMKATNDLKSMKCTKRGVLEPMLVMLAPFAPFVTEELWSLLGNESSIHQNGVFPVFEEKYLVEDSFTYPVQIGKKVRAKVDFPADATKEEIQEQILQLEEIQKWIEGKEIKKVVVVPKRLVNIVAI